MSQPPIATLLLGSALGSTILGVIFALVQIKKDNIDGTLLVNIEFASAPAKHFFKTAKVTDLFKIIDMPVSMKEIRGVLHPVTTELNGLELFYSPGTPSYSFFETDYDLLQETFTLFWKSLDLYIEAPLPDTVLHIRRGDKLIYEQSLKVHLVEEYKDQIEKLNLENTDITIVTDQYDVYTDFKQLCPDWTIKTTSSSTNVGFNITNINKDTTQNIKNEVDRMIADFNVIYNSKYFIGTSSSSVSVIGRLLKNNTNFIILS